MIELAKTDDGRARIARVDVRTDQYLADRVEQGDQRTAQGGIETAVEAPRVNPPLETFEFTPIAKSVSENERFVDRVIETPTGTSTNDATAGSSGDDRRELRVDDHEQAEDIMNDQHVEAANGGGMDLDLLESNVVETTQLASGRKCNRLQGQWSSLPVRSTGTVREGRHRKLIMGDGLIVELSHGEARTEAPVAPTAAPAQETDSTTEYDSDLRDFMKLFESSERPEARSQSERLIATIEALGGDGKSFQRERARNARAIIAEIYSPPRVTAAANRLPKYGLEPGLALDITIDDESGRPWDFSIKSQRDKAEALIDSQLPVLLIGSPMCNVFSAIQAINNIPGKRDPAIVAREQAAGRLHLAWCCQMYRRQAARGAYFLHEHPAGATSWT